MTHEEDLRRLLNDAATEIPAGNAPVAELVREGRRSKSRRHIVQGASVAAAVAVIAVGAFILGPSIGGSSNLAAQPTTSPRGQAVSGEATTEPNASAFVRCEALVDGKTYTELIDARDVPVDHFREWLLTRTKGVYSPSQIADVPETGSVTVCALLAPLAAHPGPPTPGSEPSNALPVEPQAVILFLDSESRSPSLDSIGPLSSVMGLMAKLATTGSRQTPTERDLLGQWRAVGELEQQLESAGFPDGSRVLAFSHPAGRFLWGANDECNYWSGRFRIGVDGEFSTNRTFATQVGCRSLDVVTVPEVVVEASQVRLIASQLRLFDEEGSLLATFERLEATSTPTTPPNTPTLPPTPAANGIRVAISSHCGVRSAWVKGDLWLASPPLGGHNPPPGWDENETVGSFVITADGRAKFYGDGGQKARFRLASPGSADPNGGCE
jgi:hypothetical protein